MTGFQGMDTAQVEDFRGLLGNRRSAIDDRFGALDGLVRSIVGSQWIGPDADDFAQRYGSEVTTRVREALGLLQAKVAELLEHIEEQDSASEVEGGGFFGELFSAVGEAFEAVGNFLAEVWDDFVGDILPTIADGVSIVAGTIADAVRSGIDDAMKAAPDVARSTGKRLLASALPFVGDVATGIFAGIDRWQQDGSRHPDMGFGERLGRAVLDGGLNAGGSFLGGTFGSAIGGPVGAAIGGLVGGAGGAAATSPTGPGAVVGLGAGGAGGGGLGATIGIYVGDVIGSYFGGRAGDSIADAILD